MIRFADHIRLFFNRHTLDDLVWIVAAPGFEIAVRSVEMRGVVLVTKYEPQLVIEGPRRHDGPPSAWFEGDATVEITSDGRALLTPIGA